MNGKNCQKLTKLLNWAVCLPDSHLLYTAAVLLPHAEFVPNDHREDEHRLNDFYARSYV